MAENTLLEKVLSLEGKFKSIQDQLSDPSVMSDMKKYVQLNKDYKELEPIIQKGHEYEKVVSDLQSAKDIFLNEKDEDLREMAREEISELEPRVPALEQEIKLLLIPADPDDSKNAIVESAAAQEATKPPFLPATFSVCISTLRSPAVGGSKSPTRPPAPPAASSR